MPLAKQIVGVDFTHGVDKKTDAKLTVPGSLDVLQNGQFDAANTISKRLGYGALGTSILGGSSIAAGKSLTTRGNELLLNNGTTLYSRASALSKWVNRGDFTQALVDIQTVASGGTRKTQYDCAYFSGLICVVWHDQTFLGADEIRYTVLESFTGARIVDNVVVATSATAPRVVTGTTIAGSFFLILYNAGSNNLKAKSFTTSDPTTLSAASTISSTLNGLFDADYNSTLSQVVVANRSTTSGHVDVCTAAITGTVTATASFSLTCSSGLAVCNYADGHIGLAHSNSTTFYVSVIDSGLLSVSTLSESLGAEVINVGGCRNGSNVLWAYEVALVSVKAKEITTAAALAVGGLTLNVLGMFLASKPFQPGNGQTYVACLYVSELQPTVFVLNITASGNTCVAARILPGLGTQYDASSASRISGTFIDATGRLGFLVGEMALADFLPGTTASATGLALAQLTFSGFQLPSVEYMGSRIWSGGAAIMHDGVSPVEYGFHIYPEALAVTDNGTSGGVSTAGTYQVVAVYEWMDAQGVLHESIPSPPASITLAAGHCAAVGVPMLRLTQKKAPRANVVITLYCTTANGTIFYRAVTAENDPTSAAATIIQTASDATLAESEILYTVGGVLDNEAPPACKTICVHQGRLVVGGLEEPQAFRYSKQRVTGFGSGFSDVMQGLVPPDYGRVTGIASQDDKLLLFAERGIYYMSGQGPVDTGQQNGYSDPQLVTSAFGCSVSAPSSVFVAPPGTFFLSDKGIRLVDRTLQVDPSFGAQVDALATACIATLAPTGKSQVHFFTGTDALVYDYLWGQWSTFSNQNAVDACVWFGNIVHLSSAGVVYQHGDATDNGTAVSLSVTTGWLKMAGVQGFQRVYTFLLLGKFLATSTLSVEVGYDYEDAWSTAETTTTGSLFTTSVPLQVQVKIARQKCEAIRFRISEAGGSGAGFSLTNMALELGLRPGAYKLPSTKTI